MSEEPRGASRRGPPVLQSAPLGSRLRPDDTMARQMVNFVYLIGDRETGEAVVVDPAYAVQDLLDIVAEDGMRLTGVLGTHFHPDHLGGTMGGWSFEGIGAFLEKVWCRSTSRPTSSPGSSAPPASTGTDLVGHDSGDIIDVGRSGSSSSTRRATRRAASASSSTARLVAVTPSSESCGRTDFPGSDPLAMYESIHTRRPGPRRRHPLPRPSLLGGPLPEHGGDEAVERVFRPRTAEEWMAMFGQ